jgi:hypothetical protein
MWLFSKRIVERVSTCFYFLMRARMEKEISKKLFIKVLTALRTVNRMRPTSDDNCDVEDLSPHRLEA